LSRIESAGATFPAAPRREGSRRRRLFGPGGLAAAAVAAAAVLAVIGLFVWNASLRNANEDLRGEVETHQTYELQGSGPAENVRGQVVEIGDDRGVLVAENLPSTPEGEVYETWLMRGGVPEPAGLFQPKNEGDAATPIEGSLEDADAVAVTVEPSGGSSAPTSEILLTATL
jgi:anti-sigma-K factor RskA